MTVMSGQQERLMDQLLKIAGGDVGLVEEAFKNAPREAGEPPAIEDVIYEILESRGLGAVAARVRQEVGSGEAAAV